MNEKEEKALSAFEQGRTALGEAGVGVVPRDVAGELLTVSTSSNMGMGEDTGDQPPFRGRGKGR